MIRSGARIDKYYLGPVANVYGHIVCCSRLRPYSVLIPVIATR